MDSLESIIKISNQSALHKGILLPLMEDGIITIEQAKYDGHESLSYVGSDQMLKGEGRQSKDIDKTDPFAWTIAFNKLFAQ